MSADPAAGELPPAIAELVREPHRVPLVYAHLRRAEAPVQVQRVAESPHHRAPVYACLSFYKHVSRCVGGDE